MRSPWSLWISPITPFSCVTRRTVATWSTSFTTVSLFSSPLTVFPSTRSFPACRVAVIMLQTSVDSTCKSPHFFVPSHHIITIGQEKNLCNRTVDKSSLSSPPLSIPLSPFCLDEMQSPSHDSDNSPRQPDPPAPSCPGHRSMIHSTTPTRTPTRRLRSVSMFERDPAETSSTTTQTVSSGDAAASVWKEPRGRRHRGYSVHDIILQTKEEPVTDAPAMPAMPAVPVGE